MERNAVREVDLGGRGAEKPNISIILVSSYKTGGAQARNNEDPGQGIAKTPTRE